MSLIELHQVVKEYAVGETRLAALRGIDLAIGVGECVAIWRPSGSGNSTRCNLIGMLDSATSGTVRLAGQDVSALSDDQRSALRNQAIGSVWRQELIRPIQRILCSARTLYLCNTCRHAYGTGSTSACAGYTKATITATEV